MKRMTKAEKLAKEELTKTQVLNLSELERIANYEKRTSKKPAAFFAILGVMLITIGVSYNGIVNIFNGTPAKENEGTVAHKEVDKNDKAPEPVGTLNCQYTNLANSDGQDTNVTMTLIFNNGNLKSYTKIMSITPTPGQEALAATTIPQLLTNYQAFETVPVPGYQIISNAKGTGFETIVAIDLATLDSTRLISHHHNNVVTKVEFAFDDTKEMVMTKAADLGYICQ